MTQILRPGDRAYAARLNGRNLDLFGVGVYRGEEIPQAGIPGAPAAHRAEGRLQGRVDLDDGGFVYRCEAFFDAESELAGRKTRKISLDEFRARARGNAPMVRRTRGRGPDQNTTLEPEELQFEPGNHFPSGHHRAYSEPGISVWFPGPELPPPYVGGALGRRRCMVRISISNRGGKSSSGTAWLSKTELGELLEYLNALYVQMEDVP